jgi:large subunit ribosomal protein L17
MRHRVAGYRLNRSHGHRRSLRRNLITALFQHGRIRTTEAKARSIRSEAEKLITKGKRGDLHARRQVAAVLTDPDTTRKVFDELAPRYATRAGGYTRMLKLGRRQGDGAEMVILELV